jgi:hypothetical protein
MFQDIMDELQFFPLVFNFDICGFDTYGTLVARINRMYRGLPVLLADRYCPVLYRQATVLRDRKLQRAEARRQIDRHHNGNGALIYWLYSEGNVPCSLVFQSTQESSKKSWQLLRAQEVFRL